MLSVFSPRLAVIGRLFFAVALAAFGLQHLILGRFVTRLVPPVSPWGPLPPGLSPLVGILLLAIAVCVALRVRLTAVSLGFALSCLVSFVLLHLPIARAAGAWGGEWTSAGKALTFCAVGLATAGLARSGDALDRWAGAPALDWAARFFFAAFLVLCGIQHFLWWQFVQTLVPSWIPGPRFWTYFAAVALIAGGVGLMIPPTRRLAAALTGWMIFLWVFLVHIPRALTIRNANETTAVFEALAFAGLGWILAARASSSNE